jgi:hypothetical protein
MPNRLSRRTFIAALVAAGPSAALAQTVGAPAAPATPPAPPAPITGPQLAAPPTDLKAPYPEAGKVNRLDPRLDALIDADAKVEKICDGFLHAEGPVWVGGSNGYLLGLRHPGQPHRQVVAYRGAVRSGWSLRAMTSAE